MKRLSRKIHNIKTLVCASCMISSAMICSEEPTTASLTQQLHDQYEKIESITCEIRKNTTGESETVRMLSRVFFQKPDHLNVENISPMKRRIVADGTNFYYHEYGAKLGFSRPVRDLDELWMNSLRNIPGSPMLYITKICGLPETQLPPTNNYPVRRGIKAEKSFVVLSCDSSRRLARIESFKSEDMKEIIAIYNFDDFREIAPGCFLPRRHSIKTFLPDGSILNETSLIKIISVNEKIPENLFNPSFYFKNIEFTDDFSRTFDEYGK